MKGHQARIISLIGIETSRTEGKRDLWNVSCIRVETGSDPSTKPFARAYAHPALNSSIESGSGSGSSQIVVLILPVLFSLSYYGYREGQFKVLMR